MKRPTKDWRPPWHADRLNDAVELVHTLERTHALSPRARHTAAIILGYVAMYEHCEFGEFPWPKLDRSIDRLMRQSKTSPQPTAFGRLAPRFTAAESVTAAA